MKKMKHLDLSDSAFSPSLYGSRGETQGLIAWAVCPVSVGCVLEKESLTAFKG